MAESPLGPAPEGAASKLATKLAVVGLRSTLAVSPRPAALALRYLFRKSAVERGTCQLKDAPADIVAFLDERYDPSPDAFLDVYVPAEAVRSGSVLPVVVWTHGGAFVGGSKEEIGGYLRMIAARGFVVVGIRYALAPEAKYPMPVRQLMAALHHVEGHATRLHIDPERVVLAGDSAGAQISAQVAALVTNPGYATELDVPSTIDPSHLRGVALCCGIFDITAIPNNGPFSALLMAVGWAYSGTRDYRSNEFFASTISVPGRVTKTFPPTFITAGNADPLLPQSLAFAATLGQNETDLETLFFDEHHEPPLGHEYQFELGWPEGRMAFDQLVGFFKRCTRPD